MLILSGGKWKGRKFARQVSVKTRPTAIRAREGLFNVLEHRYGGLHGLRVADLFAGTGALGLEALSRGADYCCFVEQDRRAAVELEGLVRSLKTSASVIQASALNCRFDQEPFDLVFLDPPYGQDLLVKAIANVLKSNVLSEAGLIIAEMDKNEAAPDLADHGLELIQDRAWGRNRFLFWRKTSG